MNDEEFEAFAEVWQHVMRIYSKTADAGQLDIMFEALRHRSLAEIQDALRKHVLSPDNGQFPPKPADIERAIGGTSEMQAASAWAKLRRGMRKVGNFRSAVFDDERIHACVADMGGWVKVNSWQSSEVPYRQREFEKLYAGYCRSGVVPSHPSVLLGSYARFEPNAITFVGNPEGCTRVIENGAQKGAQSAKLPEAAKRLVHQVREEDSGDGTQRQD